ncbi:uncharacterized protein LOC129600412 isoform X2 [Paramacrobiotus metropolitanus]|uniref:uncharacterized protein LOC129600412 isoform X2 n=1 Tax=Paramacrobiotus metropolitanus TaxID=2943436 RepID=UPI00244624E0|nr:uncharacterized protein LOC129600412 isoform X2 [Paramacrobiotus metropolitanus]
MISTKTVMEGKWLATSALRKLFWITIVEIVLGLIWSAFEVWNIIRTGDQINFEYMLYKTVDVTTAVILLCTGITGQHAIRRSRAGIPQATVFLWEILLNVIVLTHSSITVFFQVVWQTRRFLRRDEFVLDELMWTYNVVPIVLGLVIMGTTYRAIKICNRCYRVVCVDKAFTMADEEEEFGEERGMDEVAAEERLSQAVSCGPPPAYEDVING